MEVAISIFFGALITIVTAMGVEYLRRPRLSLAIEDPPKDLPSQDGQNMRRHLRLNLRNAALPFGARWMQRASAIQIRGEITFHHLNDGQDVFDRAMPVRWARSPEPIPNQIVDTSGKLHFHIVEMARSAKHSRIDVYPGEEELLDVVVRFDDEADCYGWNNDSYFTNWRNPKWRLVRERYLIKVVITSSGQKCVGVFRLINDVDSRSDFRLMAASADDRAKVLK